MTYSIYSRGHLVVSYRDAEEEARHALVELAREAPEQAELLTLMAVHDSGTVSTGYTVNADGKIAEHRTVAHAA